MTNAAARKLWITLETLHDVVYFSPGVRDAGVALGLRGYWMTYFAFRAAPLGHVDASVVVATFAGFHPDMVGKALPDAWSRTTPDACLDTRSAVAVAGMRAVGVDADACAQASALLEPFAADADYSGRALAAANARLPLPADPLGALWQLASTLREHRGDGHVAAFVAAGLSGLDAQVMQAAAGRVPAELMREFRGWSLDEWTAAADRLEAAGLIIGQTLTDIGRAQLAAIEDATDLAAWNGGLAQLGETAVDAVYQLLRPSTMAVHRSGLVPVDNPIGLPLED